MQRVRKATSCGEQTAERRHEQLTATAATLAASRFHTVTTSEPAAPTRIVGVRPRTGIVLGMPLRQQDVYPMRSMDKTQQSYRSHSVSIHSSSSNDSRSRSGNEIEWESDVDETIEPTQTRVSHRSASSILLQEDVLSRIGTLKALCDEGFISPEDYERFARPTAINQSDLELIYLSLCCRRKNAVMDEITFPSVARSGQYSVTQTNQDQRSQGEPFPRSCGDSLIRCLS